LADISSLSAALGASGCRQCLGKHLACFSIEAEDPPIKQHIDRMLAGTIEHELRARFAKMTPQPSRCGSRVCAGRAHR
jgi:hypothetical protein